MAFISKGKVETIEDSYLTEQYLIEKLLNVDVGTVWAWGGNEYGQLGLSSTVNYSSPIQLGTLTTWVNVESGGGPTESSTALIDAYNQLWTCGSNVIGQLGLNDRTNRSSPVQVGTLTNWSRISIGGNTVGAIKTDNTLWMWGNNGNRSLGLSNNISQSSPVQVGSLTDWQHIAAGATQSFAIKTDGTLWAWGVNGDGNTWGLLGVSTQTHRSSPIQIGTLTNWRYVSTSGGVTLAIKTDNTLWAWGYNTWGYLGLNDRVHRSSPTQVGSMTDWGNVVTYGQMTAAIKTDGTLWTWGYNFSGSLGLNTLTHRSSPTQVGSLTNWKTISICSTSGNDILSSCLATKTDGTLWTWGNSNFGEMGLNDNSRRLSPVQVGTDNVWTKIASSTHVIALK